MSGGTKRRMSIKFVEIQACWRGRGCSAVQVMCCGSGSAPSPPPPRVRLGIVWSRINSPGTVRNVLSVESLSNFQALVLLHWRTACVCSGCLLWFALGSGLLPGRCKINRTTIQFGLTQSTDLAGAKGCARHSSFAPMTGASGTSVALENRCEKRASIASTY